MFQIHLKVKNGKKQLAHPQYNSDLIDYDYMVMTVSRIVSDKTDTSAGQGIDSLQHRLICVKVL